MSKYVFHSLCAKVTRGASVKGDRISNNVRSTPLFKLHLLDKMYLCGMMLVHVYVEYTPYLLFNDHKLEFLPLLIVSVYTSLGVMYVYIELLLKT